MSLAMPLSQQQVNAAARVHDKLKMWLRAESTLQLLSARCPEFTQEACLLKAVVVNDIYGTQLFATVRMASHIHSIFENSDYSPGDIGLVDRIAQLPPKAGDKPRLAISFASKFCHFFVNAEDFPIYDDAARDTLKLHLGSGCTIEQSKPYASFCKNFRNLHALAKLTATTKELDQYLWLTGMFIRWQKEKAKSNPRVNAELKAMFQSPGPELGSALKTMLPEHLAMMIYL